MSGAILEIGGRRALILPAEGPPLARDGDANDFISAAWAHEAGVVAIPTARLTDDFFRLSTGLAGEVVQRFVNYRLHLVILGDVPPWASESRAFRDFVYESNKGAMLWFVTNAAELQARLERLPPAG